MVNGTANRWPITYRHQEIELPHQRRRILVLIFRKSRSTDPKFLAITFIDALNVPSLQSLQLLPFALSLVMQKLTAPWQIIRLAIRMAASDDELRVAATPYGIAVSIALHDLSVLAASLRLDIRRGRFEDVAEHLKALHDGVRGRS